MISKSRTFKGDGPAFLFEDRFFPGYQPTFRARIVHIHPWSDNDEELYVRMVSEFDPPDLAGLKATINTGITNFGIDRDGKVGRLRVCLISADDDLIASR